MKKSDALAIKIIVNIIHEMHGYDFSNYSQASLKRRLIFHQGKKGLPSLADMIPLLLNEPHYLDELISDISVTVTEMFRDPEFYAAFKEKVIPTLKTYSYMKIWHAGCSTGQEVYSMAILLHEEGLLPRVQLYSTDFNPYALEVAKEGIYPEESFDEYKRNYDNYGGSKNFEDYFLRKYKKIKIDSALQKKILFYQHNLAADKSFGEVEVIVCRNVMIYFDQYLKEKVIQLFRESLVDYGYLCLGAKEHLSMEGFKCISHEACIYQKVPYEE